MPIWRCKRRSGGDGAKGLRENRSLEKIVNHKRKRSKNKRAGCMLCKPNKMSGWAKHRILGHTGFGKLRDEQHSRRDLADGVTGHQG